MIIIFHCSSRSALNSSDKLCGMVLSSLTSERGQPTGLSLACSSPAIIEALQQLVGISTFRNSHHTDSGKSLPS